MKIAIAATWIVSLTLVKLLSYYETNITKTEVQEILRNDRFGYSNSTDTEKIQTHVKHKTPQKSR